MRVLVTGGSGYIGSRVLRGLAERDDVEEVVDLDLRPPPAGIPKVRFVERSVTEDLRDALAGIDVALHLAWVLDPMHDTARQTEICIGGTRRFLEACGAAGVRHLFFMSSATAYGAHPSRPEPLDESAPLLPEHHFQYSAEKRQAEALVQAWAAEHPGALVQIARPCVVGGPNVSNFIFRAISQKVTLRPLGIDPRFQLVHEDDAAAAVVAIVRSRLPGAFNVAADGVVSLLEMYPRLGVRALPVPLPAMLAVAGLAWRLGLRGLAEAPPGFVHFVAYPWLVSNRRLKEEAGFRFRYTADQVVDAYLAARSR